MAQKIENLMQALVAKLYATITGNDPAVKLPRNKFVTWMMPGIPFSTTDFSFCSRGFVGDTAEQTQLLYHQAFVLSKLFDFVPEVNTQFLSDDMQQAIFTTTQDTISSIYKDVLTHSKVVNIEPTEEQKEKIKRFRDLLVVTKEETNIVTGEKRTITHPGPLTIAYNEKMNDYITAADEYMNLLIDAQSARGSDTEAIRRVQAFASKQNFMVQKMQAAEMAWTSEGYRNEYEEINAYIQQVTQRSMVLYKADLLQKLESSILASPSDGGTQFHYTTLLPGNFAESTAWATFRFNEEDYETHKNKSTTQWNAGGGAGLLGFGAKASVKSSKEKKTIDAEWSKFTATFEFTQVQICRPFFEQGFFAMRGWTLDELWNLNFDNKPVSDGAEKPTGRLVAYPTSALFVRNVVFKFDEAKKHFDENKESLDGGGGASYGLFNASGSYTKSSETVNRSAHIEGNELKIDGMQLIGFINNIIKKSPDTNPEISPEDFV
ncbi:hypothetical protein [Ferruginibacter sp.]|nr:hypothetical protein [Ferruginibacter sp.]